MLFIFVLLSITPLVGVALMFRWAYRHQSLTPAMKNAGATGCAAMFLVLACFDIIGFQRFGPWSAEPLATWSWQLPLFSLVAGVFAAASGWACASIYLALREFGRGRWGQERCPSPWHTAIASCLIMALTAGYLEAAQWLVSYLKTQ